MGSSAEGERLLDGAVVMEDVAIGGGRGRARLKKNIFYIIYL